MRRRTEQIAHAICRIAIARTERHIELHPNDARALYLGAGAWLQLGDRERCLEWTERALAIDPEENTTLYNVACTYAQLGENDRALQLLEITARNGFGNKEWMENDPDLASLRSDPRFARVLETMAARQTKSDDTITLGS